MAKEADPKTPETPPDPPKADPPPAVPDPIPGPPHGEEGHTCEGCGAFWNPKTKTTLFPKPKAKPKADEPPAPATKPHPLGWFFGE